MILSVGVDYHNMALGDRELFSLSPDRLPEVYRKIKPLFSDTVFLSTCNRMEVYFSGNPDDTAAMIDWIITHFIPADNPPERIAELKTKFYHHQGSGAVRHLFEVAAGLHSMVVGENQILHQIKRAYQEACEHLRMEADFHKLFQTALGVGKKVRTQTDIGKGGMSLGSVSVDIIKKLYEKNAHFTVALIGAGEIAGEVLNALLHHGQIRVQVCNRDPERARRLIARYERFYAVEYIPFDMRYQAAAAANVTVVSTNAPEYVLTRPELEKAFGGHYRFSFFIDLSVPRNIDPAIAELQDLVVYTLDDLDKIIVENYSQRSSQITLCHNLIEKQVQNYLAWAHKRKFFLLREEWRGMLEDINRERKENREKIIPMEKLEFFFEKIYPELAFDDTAQREIDNFLKKDRGMKDFLKKSLEMVVLPYNNSEEKP